MQSYEFSEEEVVNTQDFVTFTGLRKSCPNREARELDMSLDYLCFSLVRLAVLHVNHEHIDDFGDLVREIIVRSATKIINKKKE